MRDMFRLGKVNRSSTTLSQTRPRPILIKLSVAWDHKLALLRKRNLQNFRIKRLFIREDLPLELRQQRTSKVRHAESTVDRSGDQQLAHSPFPETSSDFALLEQEHSTTLSDPVAVVERSESANSRSRRVSSRSLPPTRLASERSDASRLSPSPHSLCSSVESALSSSSTLVQDHSDSS